MEVRRCVVSANPRVFSTAACATVIALLAASRDASAGSACNSLRQLTLPSATITDSIEVAANSAPFYSPRGFCRVLVTIAPTPESDIKAEVWLPSSDWNGKFQGVGNADAAGVISYDAMIEAIRRGYATSSTDTGHVGNTMAFALGHREKYVDFGYRAVHEMTDRAKTIVEAFYGAPPQLSIWNGCSQGGRQGITEAIRYPSDYDAIIAGAPAIAYMHLHAMRLALNTFVHRADDSYIPPDKYPVLYRAAVKACDSVDGIADGLITNPSVCRFDPAVLECGKGDSSSCLTPAQVETARGMYAPITDPANGRVLSSPLLQPGSELGWARLAGTEPLTNAVEPFKYVVFKNAKWDWRTFRLSTDLPQALRADQGVIDRTDANLERFFDAGGKLLLYHGWSDPQVPAMATVAYFNEVLKKTGEERRGTAIELYMQPGVNHCWGGDGPDTFDAVGAMEQWMQTGRAPTRITASQWSATVNRTRPLCPYPQVAQYVGHGSINRADSFVCTAADTRSTTLPAVHSTSRRTESMR